MLTILQKNVARNVYKPKDVTVTSTFSVPHNKFTADDCSTATAIVSMQMQITLTDAIVVQEIVCWHLYLCEHSHPVVNSLVSGMPHTQYPTEHTSEDI